MNIRTGNRAVQEVFVIAAPVSFNWKFFLRAALLLLGSVGAVGSGFLMLRSSERTASWPSAPGTILSREIVTETTYMGKNIDTSVCYRGIVRYSYEIPSGRWVNDDIYYRGSPCQQGDNGKKLAERLVAPYEVGSRVKVYYNPAYPGQACLVPGQAPDGKVLLVLGGMGLAAFCIYLGGFLRNRRRAA